VTTNVLDQLRAEENAATRAAQAAAAEQARAVATALAKYQDALANKRIRDMPLETIKGWKVLLGITSTDIEADIEAHKARAELLVKLADLPTAETTEGLTKDAIAREKSLKVHHQLETRAAVQEVTDCQKFHEKTKKDRADLAQKIEALLSNSRAFPNE
jgi:hypothetical protein